METDYFRSWYMNDDIKLLIRDMSDENNLSYLVFRLCSTEEEAYWGIKD